MGATNNSVNQFLGNLNADSPYNFQTGKLDAKNTAYDAFGLVTGGLYGGLSKAAGGVAAIDNIGNAVAVTNGVIQSGDKSTAGQVCNIVGVGAGVGTGVALSELTPLISIPAGYAVQKLATGLCKTAVGLVNGEAPEITKSTTQNLRAGSSDVASASNASSSPPTVQSGSPAATAAAIVSQFRPSTDYQGSDGAYTVQKGQTLTAIAKENGIGLSDLVATNPQITDPNSIRTGQVIRLPSNASNYKPGTSDASDIPNDSAQTNALASTLANSTDPQPTVVMENSGAIAVISASTQQVTMIGNDGSTTTMSLSAYQADAQQTYNSAVAAGYIDPNAPIAYTDYQNGLSAVTYADGSATLVTANGVIYQDASGNLSAVNIDGTVWAYNAITGQQISASTVGDAFVTNYFDANGTQTSSTSLVSFGPNQDGLDQSLFIAQDGTASYSLGGNTVYQTAGPATVTLDNGSFNVSYVSDGGTTVTTQINTANSYIDTSYTLSGALPGSDLSLNYSTDPATGSSQLTGLSTGSTPVYDNSQPGNSASFDTAFTQFTTSTDSGASSTALSGFSLTLSNIQTDISTGNTQSLPVDTSTWVDTSSLALVQSTSLENTTTYQGDVTNPTDVATVEVISSPPPVTYSPPPVTFSPPPGTFSPPPVTYSPPPVTYSPPPVTYSPPPVTFSPPPVTYSPPPITFSPPPVTYSPPPITFSPPPVTYSPPPVTYSPPPVTYSPPPYSPPPFSFPSFTPLVLSLDGQGINLTNLSQSNAYFDYDNTGTRLHTGWVGADTGLLVYLPTGTDTVSNGTQLIHTFGDLAALDTNHDGVINSQDDAYTHLQVWADGNGDGVDQSGELHSLTSLGIQSISVTPTPVQRPVGSNLITEVGTVTFTNGKTEAIDDATFASLAVTPASIALSGQSSKSLQLLSKVTQGVDAQAQGEAKAVATKASSLLASNTAIEQGLITHMGQAPSRGTSHVTNGIVIQLSGKDSKGRAITAQEVISAPAATKQASDSVRFALSQIQSAASAIASASHNESQSDSAAVSANLQNSIIGSTQDVQARSAAKVTEGNWNSAFVGLASAVNALQSASTNVLTAQSVLNQVSLTSLPSGGSATWSSAKFLTSWDAQLAADASATQNASSQDVVMGSVAVNSLLTAAATAWGTTHAVILGSTSTVSQPNTLVIAANGSQSVDDTAGQNIYAALPGCQLTIANFHAGSAGSKLAFLQSSGAVTIAQAGADTIIKQGTSTVTLSGVNASALSLYDNLLGASTVTSLTPGLALNLGTPSALIDDGYTHVQAIVENNGSIAIGDKGLITLNGNLNTIHGGSGDVATIAGNGNAFVGTTNNTLNLSGQTNTATLSHSTIGIAGNSSATVLGQTNAFSLASSSTVDVQGDSNAVQADATAVIAVSGNNNMIYGAGSETVTLSGNHNTADVSNSVVSASGGSSTSINGDLNQISLGDGGSLSVVGHDDSVIAGNSSTITLTGDNNSLTAGSGNTVTVSGQNERISASNSTVLAQSGSSVTITGGTGNDTLVAVSGVVTLIGGTGGDTFVINNTADVVQAQTGGVNTIQTSVSYTAGANVQNLVGTGSGNLSLTGGAQTTSITANSGNDTLVVGSGVATLIGGTGNDTFVVNNTADVVQAQAGSVNTIQTSVSYTASTNVANLTGTGSGNLTLTGNGQADVITANSGNDTLVAGSGVATLIGGAGNDTFVFNNTADVVQAQAGGVNTIQTSVSYTASTNVANLTGTGSGNLMLTGNGQTNVITANSGNDTLVAGTGVATLIGGAGNDTFVVNNTADVVQAQAGGINTIQTSVSYTASTNVANLTGTGTGNLTLTGNGQTNVITANSGNDTLVAGSGVATLIGGVGNDTFVVNNTADVVQAKTGGINTIQTSVSYTASTNVANLTGTGTGNLTLTGNGQTNVITANSGNDTLVAGTGAATLVGGAGNDTFVVNNTADVVQAKSGGINAIQTSVSYTAGANVQSLVGTGSGNLTLTGGTQTTLIAANSGNDTLIAGLGEATLTSGSGVCTLVGGAGNDTFVVNNTADVVQAKAGGINTIQTSVSYTASANVLNLTGIGSANITLTGNTLNNVITGNAGNDTLIAGSGNDTLVAGSGVDTMIGGSGNDTFVVNNTADVVQAKAGSNVNTILSYVSYTASANVLNLTGVGSANITLTGNSLNNVITGNAGTDTLVAGTGNDTLIAGTGVDTMIGGYGNETFVVNNTADVVQAKWNGCNTNTIQSSVTYTASANVQNLTGIGTGAITLTGNNLYNVITANNGNDTLVAGSGLATLVGGAGNDTFVINNACDVVQAQVGGVNTIQTSVSYTASANVQNLTGTGNTAITLTGNSLNNVITANSGNDVLIAGSGVDTIIGGVGNEIVYAYNSKDTIQLGDGCNSVYGGNAAITLTAGNGGNYVSLGDGASQITAGNGADNIQLGQGNNQITLGNGNDIIGVGNGANGIKTGNGNSYITAGSGNDTVTVGNGSNQISVGSGNDQVSVGDGCNTVQLGCGTDQVTLGRGTDTVNLGTGNDTVLIGTVAGDASDTGKDTLNPALTIFAHTDNIKFTGASSSQLWFKQCGLDLDIQVIGTNRHVDVANWFLLGTGQSFTVTADDGKQATFSQVNALSSAMAAFNPPAAGSTTLPSNYDQQLHTVIASNWH